MHGYMLHYVNGKLFNVIMGKCTDLVIGENTFLEAKNVCTCNYFLVCYLKIIN